MNKIAIGIATVGGGLIYLSFRVSNLNLSLLIVGGTMLILGLLANFVLINKADQAEQAEFNQWKDQLMSLGDTIAVDFDQCELKSNQYVEQIQQEELYHPYMALMAFEPLTEPSDPETQAVHLQRIIYTTIYKGKTKSFISPIIPKDEISLRVRLNQQQHTNIYIDRDNPDNYFFDLLFLAEE